MKIGTENKTKTILAAGLGILALFMVYRAFRGDEETPAPQTAAAKVPASTGSTATSAIAPPRAATSNARNAPHALLAQTLDPTLRFDLLKSSEEVSYTGSGRDIFRSQPPPPPVPKVVAPVVDTSKPPPPPPPPPINLKFYGFASRKGGGDKSIFLSSGDDIFIAKEGQIVNRRYKIVKVNPTSIDVEDVLTNNRQTIYLTTG